MATKSSPMDAPSQLRDGAVLSPPVQSAQVRFCLPQPRMHAAEARNRRHPWYILSPPERMRAGTFIGCLVTHASERAHCESTNLLYQNVCLSPRPTDPRPSYLDAQNIWTLTFQHISPYDRTYYHVTAPPRRELLDIIRSRFVFRPQRSKGSPWDVGRVCTVTLYSDPQVPGDLDTLRALLTIPTVSIAAYSDVLEVPCLIVATDQDDRRLASRIWNAVTVAPLVHSPRLLELDNPSLPLPPPNDTSTRVAVLTQLLMTVNYSRKPNYPPRVTADNRYFPNYRAPDNDLARVLADIRDNFLDCVSDNEP